MAILGFHFSGIFKEKLLNNTKTATIVNGECPLKPGTEVLIYLSDKPNLFDDMIEKRIGKAIIKEVKVKQVKELTNKEATLCGAKDLDEEKQALKKFYNADEDSIVTFVRFKLTLT